MKAIVHDRYGLPEEVLEPRESIRRRWITPGSWLRRSPVCAARATRTWSARSARTTSSTYTQQDFTRGGQRYEVIVDMAGNRRLANLRRALSPRGTLVIVGGSGGRWLMGLAAPSGRWWCHPSCVNGCGDLLALTELIEAGTVAPVIDKTYELRETSEALGQVGQPHTQGKTVITV
ncbi:MAG: zinc-binding dehydrogenase [Actinomycetota bacterium]|nr:zinc-binding dehydrogenase [Actinomycetota bacterium]